MLLIQVQGHIRPGNLQAELANLSDQALCSYVRVKEDGGQAVHANNVIQATRIILARANQVKLQKAEEMIREAVIDVHNLSMLMAPVLLILKPSSRYSHR